MASDKSENKNSKNDDRIEIPIGKLRSNPWIISTVVLALVVIFLLFYKFGGSAPTGAVVSENDAGQNLLSFINSQGRGDATVVDTKRDGQLYQITVNYQDQDIPVYVTLDGKYMVVDVVSLNSTGIPSGDDSQNPGERVEIEIGDSPTLGDKNAPVVLVESTDYECPFCGRHFSETYPQIKKDYIDTGKVLYVLKDFPLSFHPEAQKAAESARCVREQKGDEGYFKMHDKLFENQDSLSVENEKKWARELGVDGAKFDKCLDDGKYEQAVKDEEAYGQTLGVQGTPASFVNGMLVSGAQPYSIFQQAIESELS